jgi:hypothetical protein
VTLCSKQLTDNLQVQKQLFVSCLTCFSCKAIAEKHAGDVVLGLLHPRLHTAVRGASVTTPFSTYFEFSTELPLLLDPAGSLFLGTDRMRQIT